MFETTSTVQERFSELLVEINRTEAPVLGHEWPNRDLDLLAVDRAGAAYVLISEQEFSPSSVVLQREHLQVFSGVEVTVRVGKNTRTGRFTAVKLMASARTHLSAFGLLASALVAALPPNPAPESIKSFINSFATLFDPEVAPDEGQVLGLWGELYVISTASNSHELLRAWHTHSDQIFDFSSAGHNLEVKTCATSERRHRFSLQQISVDREHTDVVSVHVFESNTGTSIVDLIEAISRQVDLDDAEILLRGVYSTLGTHFESVSDFRYELRDNCPIALIPANRFPHFDIEPRHAVSQVSFTVVMDAVMDPRSDVFTGWRGASDLNGSESV